MTTTSAPFDVAAARDAVKRGDADWAAHLRPALQEIERLTAEVERLRGEWRSAIRAGGKRAAEEQDKRLAAERRLHAVRMLRVWTNEDGKQFVFADELWAATDPEIHAAVERAREAVGGPALTAKQRQVCADEGAWKRVEDR